MIQTLLSHAENHPTFRIIIFSRYLLSYTRKTCGPPLTAPLSPTFLKRYSSQGMCIFPHPGRTGGAQHALLT